MICVRGCTSEPFARAKARDREHRYRDDDYDQDSRHDSFLSIVIGSNYETDTARYGRDDRVFARGSVTRYVGGAPRWIRSASSDPP